ncbi:MAG TPA: TraR/DksA C4-type zinc finger protein [Candidatus Lustribacter sp.]|nr:TraR/DksA C4-type zinc finger protein [Candidatus Lustribacter sp.]
MTTKNAAASAASPAPESGTPDRSPRSRSAKKSVLTVTAPPVRASEKPWTAQELADMRAAIESDIRQLRAEIDTAQRDLAGLMRDAGDGSGDDQADAGAKTFEREQEITLVNNARDLLEQNRHALARLDEGRYGVCESCGEPIGKFRLQAAPRATLCVTCKQKQERR